MLDSGSANAFIYNTLKLSIKLVSVPLGAFAAPVVLQRVPMIVFTALHPRTGMRYRNARYAMNHDIAQKLGMTCVNTATARLVHRPLGKRLLDVTTDSVRYR